MAMSPAESDPLPETDIRFRTRFFFYLAIWLFAALVIQVFLPPEGIVATDLTPFQQRIRWLFGIPLIAMLGLARALTWPWYPSDHSPPDSASLPALLVSICCLIAIGTITLTRHRWCYLIPALCLHATILLVSIPFYIRFSTELSD